jgi:hypothetical protein
MSGETVDTDAVDSELRVDRTQLSLVSLGDDSDVRHYWHSRTPAERLRHAELLRRINYGSAATERLERVLEVVPVGWL